MKTHTLTLTTAQIILIKNALIEENSRLKRAKVKSAYAEQVDELTFDFKSLTMRI